MQTNNTFTKVYQHYTLKAVATKGRSSYKFYKIGEEDNDKRAPTLCGKYTKKDNRLDATTVILSVDPLPINGNKRINDKAIHKAVDPKILKKVDPCLIEGIFDETDGYDEFFECLDPTMTDEDVVNYVNSVVDKLAQDSKNFTVKVKTLNNKLTYAQQVHTVDSALIRVVRKLGDLNLHHDLGKKIGLVGQFIPDYIATFAMDNEVVLLHDDADQKRIYNYDELNKNIKYIDEVKDFMAEERFDDILANPPYGKIGAEFVEETINSVDFDKFILLEPTADFIRHAPTVLGHINPEEVVTIRKGFDDAAVTTQAMIVYKDVVNNYTPDEFEVLTYMEPLLKDYFLENIHRKHYAIDDARCLTGNNDVSKINPHNTFILGERTIGSGYISTDPTTLTHRWNVLKTATVADWNLSTNNQYSQIACVFNTDNENKFFTDFVYENLDFFKLVFGAVSKNKVKVLSKVMPKPSTGWTRHYTLEELLTDYHYAADKIQAIKEKIGR